MFPLDVLEDMIDYVGFTQIRTNPNTNPRTNENIIHAIATICALSPENWQYLMHRVLSTYYTTATIDSDELLAALSKDMVLVLRNGHNIFCQLCIILQADFDIISPTIFFPQKKSFVLLENALAGRSEKIIQKMTPFIGQYLGFHWRGGIPMGGYELDKQQPPPIVSFAAKIRMQKSMIPLLANIYHAIPPKNAFLTTVAMYIPSQLVDFFEHLGLLETGNDARLFSTLYSIIEMVQIHIEINCHQFLLPFNEKCPQVVKLITLYHSLQKQNQLIRIAQHFQRLVNEELPPWFIENYNLIIISSAHEMYNRFNKLKRPLTEKYGKEENQVCRALAKCLKQGWMARDPSRPGPVYFSRYCGLRQWIESTIGICLDEYGNVL